MKQDKQDRRLAQDDTKYAAHESEMTGDYTVRTNRAQDITARILCVLAAIMLWLYVMSVDSPDWEQTFSGVLVNIENEVQLSDNYNMSVISGYDNTVSVTVKGKKSDISKYTAADLTAFVDLTGVTTAGRQQLQIGATAPAGLTVTEISPGTIWVYTDTRTTKTVPVDVNLHYAMESNIGLGVTETSITEVTVSGPAGVLDTIAYARAELDLGQVTTSMTQRVQLKLVTESGDEVTSPYVRADATDVLVTVPVYIYKDITLTVGFKYGYLNEENARVTITPSKITVRGDPQVLADFDEYQVLEIDETKITGDYSQRTKLTLPDGVTDVDKVENVTVDVVHIGTSTKQLSMASSRINVEVPENKGYAFLDAVFNFTVRAPDDMLAHILAQHMVASIDLTHYKDVVGIVTVPVTIEPLSSGLSGEIYAVGTYNIQVRLS